MTCGLFYIYKEFVRGCIARERYYRDSCHSCHLVTRGGYMKERDIERKFVAEVKKNGGLALKFITPSMSGMPDRLVLMPYGMLAFVEVKAKGKKPRPCNYRGMRC